MHDGEHVGAGELRAVAQHEMIPGHNLVGYMGQRFAGYRARIGGSTPFFGEGWPLYWELTLYDKGFHDTPEERVGALFWRMHRCARIIFSLNFHMGIWSPQEAIDFLVEKVGHERDNATAEVRRSFQGGYGPLYQAAYLLGGLQLRGLRKELVDSRQMTEKQFHDEILRQGSMPIALVRLALTKQKLSRDIYRLLGLSGYARLDFRVTDSEEAYLLEANPNPQIASDEDFASAAEAAGIEYPELIDRLIRFGMGYDPERMII